MEGKRRGEGEERKGYTYIKSTGLAPSCLRVLFLWDNTRCFYMLVYIYLYTHKRISIYMHISMYAHIHIQVYSLLKAYTHTCIRICARMHTFMHLTHANARAQTRIHSDTRGPNHVRTHAPAHEHACMCTHTRKRTHTCMRAHAHALRTRTQAHAFMRPHNAHACIRTRTREYTYTCARTRARTHPHILTTC